MLQVPLSSATPGKHPFRDYTSTWRKRPVTFHPNTRRDSLRLRLSRQGAIAGYRGIMHH